MSKELVFKAQALATGAHFGQVDKVGNDYIEHVARVAAAVRGDDTAETVAWLHDVVEDTEVTIIQVREQFGDEVADAVAAVTRDPANETYVEFGDRVIAAGPLAVKVKLSDTLDHLARNWQLPPRQRRSMGRRYMRLTERLLAAQGVTVG